MTKPIIVVKIRYKLCIVRMSFKYVVKRLLINNFSFWSNTYILYLFLQSAFDWTHTFLHPGCFV